MYQNYINLSETEKDEPIYRVFNLHRFNELIDNSKNTLVKPEKWDDPFENFLMNSTGRLPDGSLFSFGDRGLFYGQCWTRHRESDAIWRIYAPEKDGVKIRTTPRKLFTALYNQAGQFKDLSCFIGKVVYERKPQLIERFSKQSFLSSLILDSSGATQASTLLYKRVAFKHEREVRIIFRSTKPRTDLLYKYDININDLIDQIVFDPRMDHAKYRAVKKDLIAKGLKMKIVKSTLYSLKSATFDWKLEE